MDIKTIGTHNGRFHSDDVFSVALLKVLYPHAKVVRSRDLEVLDACDLVLDVGGIYDEATLRFDHHMPGGAGARENGINYSAFALIWKKFGLQYCGGNEEAWKRLDKGFVSSFDAYDNGQKTYEITTPVARIVELQDLFDNYLNPNLDEPAALSDYDRQFDIALGIATLILDRATKRRIAEVASEQYYYDTWLASPDKRYVVIEKFATSGEKSDQMPELLYCVYRAPNDTWNIKALAKSKDSYESKKPFPETWAGLRDKDLDDMTGIEGAAFCHNGRHLCGAYTKEAAIKLLDLALDA
jgi:uncharacterized UPF0160 family protein